jgi:plastocyanin
MTSPALCYAAPTFVMKARALLLAAWAIALAWAAAAAAAGTSPERLAAPPPVYRLAGRLELTQGGQPARDRALDLTRAAVWFVPDARSAPRPVAGEMATVRKQFVPGVLVVPVGSSVRFANLDPILHNAFSVSSPNGFDLGLVGAGQDKTISLREPGLVRVFCNVHHAMFAHVVVVPSAFYATPGGNGRFVLEGLPGGRGTLHWWHERGEISSRPLSVPAYGEPRPAVAVTQPRVPPHRNKLGRAYARNAYE